MRNQVFEITFAWIWDKDLTITLKLDKSALYDSFYAENYARIMLNAVVKDPKEWAIKQ